MVKNEGDMYCKFGPTKEWDIAAGHGLLKAIGGNVLTLDGKELTYNKLDYFNPHFIAYRKINS